MAFLIYGGNSEIFTVHACGRISTPSSSKENRNNLTPASISAEATSLVCLKKWKIQWSKVTHWESTPIVAILFQRFKSIPSGPLTESP